MISTEACCDLARIGELTGRRAGEANRERLHRVAHLIRHERDNQARIEPSAEHRPQWDIRHEAHSDRVAQTLEEVSRVLE